MGVKLLHLIRNFKLGQIYAFLSFFDVTKSVNLKNFQTFRFLRFSGKGHKLMLVRVTLNVIFVNLLALGICLEIF